MLKDTLALQQKLNSIATRYAVLMAHDSQSRAQGVLTSRTGKTLRSFKPAVRQDRQSGSIYAFGVKARQAAFIQNSGQSASTKSGGVVRAHTRNGNKVNSYRRTITAGNFLNQTMKAFAPRIAQRMAKEGATVIAKTLSNTLQNG